MVEAVWMRSRRFQELGDSAVPEALRANSQPEATRVTARLRTAGGIVSQLRCSDELLAHERVGDARGRGAGKASVQTEGRSAIYLSVLGDDVLAADAEEVLAVLDAREGLYGATVVEKRLNEDHDKQLKRVYGYDDDATWRGTTHKERKARPFRLHVRVALCLASDYSFAPFARGLHLGAQSVAATLRLDVRTASRVIWAWATDHRALARALGVARTTAGGDVVAFPAFVVAYEHVLRAHLDRDVGAIESDATIASAAQELGRQATAGVIEGWIPGGTGDQVITAPATRYLTVAYPTWMPDEILEDAEEAFARGASQLVRETVIGERSPEQTVRALDALGALHRPGWTADA
jgi:hypothetical protein